MLVGLAFAVAASANFPCVLLTLYWKRCNTGGIVAGMLVGTIAAVGLRWCRRISPIPRR